jgi:WD repeat-containing protein 35
MLAQCFYQLEDFGSLMRLTEVLGEGQPLLADIGAQLQSVGLCSDAVAAYLKVWLAVVAVLLLLLLDFTMPVVSREAPLSAL